MTTGTADTQATDALRGDTARFAGLYLTLRLGDETYGIPVLGVREIIGTIDVTRVPRTQPFLTGVINLRGKVIPIISLRLKFGMGEVEATEETCIIVVDIGEEPMGIVIDSVSEVVTFEAGDISPSPGLGADGEADFIQCMGKAGDKVVMLLDIAKVLDVEDFSIHEDVD
jgi:purine-binding chemotaxis protein CheW